MWFYDSMIRRDFCCCCHAFCVASPPTVLCWYSFQKDMPLDLIFHILWSSSFLLLSSHSIGILEQCSWFNWSYIFHHWLCSTSKPSNVSWSSVLACIGRICPDVVSSLPYIIVNFLKLLKDNLCLSRYSFATQISEDFAWWYSV